MPINIPGIQALARLGQMFNPRSEMPPMDYGYNQPQPEPQEPQFDPISELARLYQPRYQMRDLEEQMLQNFPQRDPNPSKWRRFGAVLAGMGSKDPIATSDQFMNYHYYNKLRDFKSQFDPIAKAADDERLANMQERQLAQGTVSAKQNQMKIEETNRKNVEAEKVRRMRAEVYRIAHDPENADMHFESKGGVVYGINPKTGETRVMRDPDTGEPIKGQYFQQRELQELRGQQRMQQIGASTAASKGNVEEAGWVLGEVKQDDGSYKTMWVNPRTQQIKDIEGATGRVTKTPTTPPPPKTTTGGGQTPSQSAREIYNLAQKLSIEQPTWAKYIILGPSSTVRLSDKTPPAIAAQIRDYVYGAGGQSIRTPGGTPAVKPPAGGTVKMYKNGQEYDIPADKAAEAETKYGYKRSR